MPKLKETEFYCVKCLEVVKAEPDTICVAHFRNRRNDTFVPALVSHCSRCDTNLTKFIKHASVDRLIDKYGEC